MNKKNKVKEVRTIVWDKLTVPLNLDLMKELIEKGSIEGYINKEGKLSDGNSFADVRLIFKLEEED